MTSAGEVFESILAGEPSDTQSLGLLSPDDRQGVLCTLCLVRVEMKLNCEARAQDIDKVLNSECCFYQDGKRTCQERPVHLYLP